MGREQRPIRLQRTAGGQCCYHCHLRRWCWCQVLLEAVTARWKHLKQLQTRCHSGRYRQHSRYHRPQQRQTACWSGCTLRYRPVQAQAFERLAETGRETPGQRTPWQATAHQRLQARDSQTMQPSTRQQQRRRARRQPWMASVVSTLQAVLLLRVRPQTS